MTDPEEQEFWQHFCETGAVDDYLAYRQWMARVDKGQGEADTFDDEDEYNADHIGWGRGEAEEHW